MCASRISRQYAMLLMIVSNTFDVKKYSGVEMEWTVSLRSRTQQIFILSFRIRRCSGVRPIIISAFSPLAYFDRVDIVRVFHLLVISDCDFFIKLRLSRNIIKAKCYSKCKHVKYMRPSIMIFLPTLFSNWSRYQSFINIILIQIQSSNWVRRLANNIRNYIIPLFIQVNFASCDDNTLNRSSLERFWT